MPSPTIRLLTFGALRIERADGRSVDYARHRRRLALLAAVAAAGEEGISRDRLLGLFSPESDQEHARGALNQLVYNLRRDLGDILTSDVARLTLDRQQVTSDVIDFREALSRGDRAVAARLYTGPFLEGFFLGDAPEFDQWLDAERERLRRAARAALEQLVREVPGDATEWWRRLTELDPHDGRAALGLMEAMVAGGDRTQAMQHAATYAERVRQDLEADPEPAVMRYAEGLKGAATLAERPLPATPPALTPSAPVPPGDNAAVPASILAARATRRWPWVLGVGTAIGVAVFLARPRRGPAAEATQPRMLVAPLENATNDTTLNPVGSFISDWLTERIAAAEVANVIDVRTARTAERNLAADATTQATGRLTALAEETHAERILAGSYRVAGDSLIAEADIIEASSGRVLARVGRVASRTDDPALAAELLSDRALGALGLLNDTRASAVLSGSRRPPRYGAYRAFAEGMDLLMQSRSADAVARFAEARALDTTFVQPLVWMADAYQQSGDLVHSDSALRLADRQRNALSSIDRGLLDYMRADLRGDRDAALEAARTLGRLAPGSEVDFILAAEALRRQRPHEALASFDRFDPEHGALKGWPGFWGWPMQAWLMLNQPDSALRVAEEGRQKHPVSRQALLHVILVRAAMGDTAALGPLLVQVDALPPEDGLPTSRILRAAAAQLAGYGYSAAATGLSRRGIALIDPGDTSANGDFNRQTLVEFLYLEGRWHDAAPIVRRMAATHPDDPRWKGMTALIAARAGDSAAALAIDRQLADDPRPAGYSTRAFWRARIHAALGHRTEMLGLLGATLASNGGDLDMSSIRIAPDFAPYRGDPDFIKLLAPKD